LSTLLIIYRAQETVIALSGNILYNSPILGRNWSNDIHPLFPLQEKG